MEGGDLYCKSIVILSRFTAPRARWGLTKEEQVDVHVAVTRGTLTSVCTPPVTLRRL